MLLKKISQIILKIIAGIFAFVFFVIYVVIPIGAPWAIRSQGSKILKHPVQVRSVWFNPVLLRLSVNGFKIMDTDKKDVIAGFNRFWADASFVSLLKKEYRVESIGVDGLVVNAALLPGNRINLMDLVPDQSQPVAANEKPEQIVPAKQAAVLPNIRIDNILLTNGSVTFTDRTVSPQFLTKLSGMSLTVTGISTKPDSIANVVFSTRLDDKGIISAEANLKPLAQPIEMETTFSLNGYALTVLTPYVGKYTGRSVKTGKMDFTMNYKIANNQLNARHKLLIQKFDFGEKVESKDALNLPFGLAVALLEDPNGRISISLPVKGDMSDPQFEYFHLIGQVARNFFMKLVTAPFMALMSIVGSESGTEEMGQVTFEPGKAGLTDKAKETLDLFVKALKERPKLSIEVNGSYDPQVDWKAMKTEAYDIEYINRRKESARSDFRVVEHMYKLRFGFRDYWKLARKHTVNKVIDESAMKEEMRRLIIEQGKADRSALDMLGQARAKAVYDHIIAGGFDPARIKIGSARETQSSMGLVPSEFTLTVYE
ncbi:MAG: DUF748 domain-containing protein [Candidatus Omnitrophota bacterium]